MLSGHGEAMEILIILESTTKQLQTAAAYSEANASLSLRGDNVRISFSALRDRSIPG